MRAMHRVIEVQRESLLDPSMDIEDSLVFFGVKVGGIRLGKASEEPGDIADILRGMKMQTGGSGETASATLKAA